MVCGRCYIIRCYTFAGFSLNNALHQIIVARYKEPSYTIDFDNFVCCMIRLESLFSESALSTFLSKMLQYKYAVNLHQYTSTFLKNNSMQPSFPNRRIQIHRQRFWCDKIELLSGMRLSGMVGSKYEDIFDNNMFFCACVL